MVISTITRDENVERGNAQVMLDGVIDAFLEAALAAKLDDGGSSGDGDGAPAG